LLSSMNDEVLGLAAGQDHRAVLDGVDKPHGVGAAIVARRAPEELSSSCSGAPPSLRQVLSTDVNRQPERLVPGNTGTRARANSPAGCPVACGCWRPTSSLPSRRRRLLHVCPG
jgi:hypothetical protein